CPERSPAPGACGPPSENRRTLSWRPRYGCSPEEKSCHRCNQPAIESRGTLGPTPNKRSNSPYENGNSEYQRSIGLPAKSNKGAGAPGKGNRGSYPTG